MQQRGEPKMKANEYVKQNGWAMARKAVAECTYGYGIDLTELKRLVESRELVKDYYGLARAKEHAESKYTAPELKAALKQAIAAVESCYD